MGFAINIDWTTEQRRNPERWENLGRMTIEQGCMHRNHPSGIIETKMVYYGHCEECGFGESSGEPMMNFAYPLECQVDIEGDELAEMLTYTCCTVMRDNDTDKDYLALCGGGKDMSQDIALAYFILEKWIPFDLCQVVSRQKCASIGEKQWPVLCEAMSESLELHRKRARENEIAWRNLAYEARKTLSTNA